MSRVFGTLVAARARLYDQGILPIYRLNYPVISVGNLTTGGTGKTPLVIELARRFQELGYRPVILSRGYRRKSRGVLIVSRGQGPEVDWQQSGDEPQLMAVRLPGVSVVVGGDRYQAGQRAEAENLGNLFILDDGFQHRKLHRDVDIVTIDPVEWAGEGRLLPEGPWREPRTSIGRAHVACVQSSPDAPDIDLPIPKFEVDTIVEGLSYQGSIHPVDTLAGKDVTAFAGIAKPERFFKLLESLGLNVTEGISFRDHHRFSPDEISKLPGQTLITTEKDAIRLPGNGFYFLRISANIQRFNELHDIIRRIID
jgi:tetraacyldisaccharide 4'-kinase